MSGLSIEKTHYECSQSFSRRSHRLDDPASLRTGKTATNNSSTPNHSHRSEHSQHPSPMMLYNHRSMRTDASLVPPIRQTASIFKQPVTVYKMQESKVKADHKGGGSAMEKPKQLIWEKRLEGLRACDLDGTQFEAMELPKSLRPVGPNVSEDTIIQSVATALHVAVQPVTGQTGSRQYLEKNPGVFLDPRQPLVQAVCISDEDIRRQEERVTLARKRLQEALSE